MWLPFNLVGKIFWAKTREFTSVEKKKIKLSLDYNYWGKKIKIKGI